MKGCPLTNELLDFFECSPDCITSSVFCQQRDKILPEAFYLLFKRFMNTYANKTNLKTYKGFRMFAVDGSDVQITPDENDKGTFYPGTNGQRPYALIHLNAFYDLENRIYEDALIQKRNDCDEGQALIDMMEKSSCIFQLTNTVKCLNLLVVIIHILSDVLPMTILNKSPCIIKVSSHSGK